MSNRCFIGIDLGGTNCRGAIVDGGKIVGREQFMPSGKNEDPESFFQRLVIFCQDLRERSEQTVAGIGLGAPGVIGDDGSVRYAPNLSCLNGFPLAKQLMGRLEIPVHIVNDANAVALGEAVFGAGSDLNSFLLMTLGTGVGGGLILNRSLWTGVDGAAGEVGHMMVVEDGRPCGCGSRGCLEQYASANGIVQTVRTAIDRGASSILQQITEKLEARHVGMAARKGDQVALEAFCEAGRKLGQILAGITNLLNLQGAIITGGASESFDLMLPAIRREMNERAFPVPAGSLVIRRGSLGEKAGILGAAQLAAEVLD